MNRKLLQCEPQSKNAAGLTLIEVAVSTGIVTLLFMVVWGLFDNAGFAFTHSVRSAHLDSTLRHATERIVNELQDSGQAEDGANHVISHVPDADTESTSLVFRRRIAMNGDAADWSSQIQYRLVTSRGEASNDGKDNDGDGIVDEQQLVRDQDGETVVLADGITAMRFRRLTGEFRMEVEISAAQALRRGDEATIRRVVTAVGLRNKP